jgi:hypothetical protein
MALQIKPLTLEQANMLVKRWHRHHKPVIGHRFSIGAKMDGINWCGAAIVGRPVARMTNQYAVAEVTRCVTDGTKNACSILYGRCAKIACDMGFEMIQTFILESETGVSLIATGWREDEEFKSGGGTWNRPSRGGRRDDQPQEPKRKFYKKFPANLVCAPGTAD